MITKNLKDKTILIIGGSSGIGLATARMAAESGARVIITSRSLQKAALAAKGILPGVQFRQLALNDEKSVNDLFKTLSDVDHIYVAAGSTKIASLTEENVDDSMTAFNERILGSLRIVKAAVDKINAGGSVTFTGGLSTDRPVPGAWVSGLGTAAAEQLARVLVMEYPQIRFNAISPGYTDTAMWDAVLGENKERVLASIAERLPVKKIAAPEDVAAAVIFLMSNPSITGEVIHIDGGGRLI